MDVLILESGAASFVAFFLSSKDSYHAPMLFFVFHRKICVSFEMTSLRQSLLIL